MRAFLLRRLLQNAILLLFISVIVYGILYLVPGGPFDQLNFGATSATAAAAQVKRLNELLGLDRPLYERYWNWLTKALVGDWGMSWTVAFGQPVGRLIQSRLGNTLLLMGLSAVFSLAIALPIGIISAVRPYSIWDYLITAFSFFGLSMPTFWFGVMMLIIFSVVLGWLPAGGAITPGKADLVDRIRHLIMPVAVLSLVQVAGQSRFIRSSMLEVLKQDYIRTARAKGVPWARVVMTHGLRNAILPVITLLGLEVPQLFGGAIITETIFTWPGMGRLFFEGISKNDWPLVQAITMVSAFLVVGGNLLADLAYAVVDPRIRYE
ncbi:MAG: ABC transporter permease [Chloroflexi bacterium]|nr:ABC transporter permease [Chloroflexota bacterium]